MIDSELGLLSDYIDRAIDPHFITDEMVLSPEDERRFTWIVIKALRIREFQWHQYTAGSLDEASWQSYMAPVPGIFASERAKAMLRFYVGSPGFMQVLHDRLGSAAPPVPPRNDRCRPHDAIARIAEVHLFEAGIASVEEAGLLSAFTEAILLLGFNWLSFSSP